MDSNLHIISKEVIRHFKEGQIASWIGDESLARKEFKKTIRAIKHLSENESKSFKHIEELASNYPLKKDFLTTDIANKNLSNINFKKRIKISYSITLISRDRAEFRAQINLPSGVLKRMSLLSNANKEIVDSDSKVNFEWTELNKELSYTAYMLLTFSDKTIFSSITTYSPATEETFKVICYDIISKIEDKVHDVLNK